MSETPGQRSASTVIYLTGGALGDSIPDTVFDIRVKGRREDVDAFAASLAGQIADSRAAFRITGY